MTFSSKHSVRLAYLGKLLYHSRDLTALKQFIPKNKRSSIFMQQIYELKDIK
jgi:hypothetical protein